MDPRIVLISVLMVSAESTNTVASPIAKRESGFDVRQGRFCVTKKYIDGLMLEIGNVVEEKSCTCEPKRNNHATKADIGEIKSEIAAIKQQVDKKPEDCEDIQNRGNLTTGVYAIYPYQKETGLQVRCDMDTATGGWTLIQRRFSISDFYKNWKSYEDGFGGPSGNFWLGNANIHMLTRQHRYTLRVDLTSMDGQTAYAEYREFTIGDAKSGYKLFINGYSGTAGDSFTSRGNGMKFSTYDRDNDIHKDNCAVMYHGAWWYAKCHTSNLNGDYGNTAYAKGPVWQPWKGNYAPMKVTEIKVRRTV